jgi:hypothetical protein
VIQKKRSVEAEEEEKERNVNAKLGEGGKNAGKNRMSDDGREAKRGRRENETLGGEIEETWLKIFHFWGQALSPGTGSPSHSTMGWPKRGGLLPTSN